MRSVLVLATNRPAQAQYFLEAWSRRNWTRTLIVEDLPEPSGLDYPDDVTVLSREEIIAASPDSDDTLFSYGDSAIKCAGFLHAVAVMGAELVLTLDDDCYPADDLDQAQFVGKHMDALFRTRVWQSTDATIRPRGLPYDLSAAFGGYVACNMGGWDGYADLDSIQTIAHEVPADHRFSRQPQLMHPGVYFPLCGMNLAFRAEFLPLMYFPRMGDGVPYRRFDDIWAGVILQKACRHMRCALTVGEPIIRHARASDPMVNLVKEAPGIAANERFWKVIDRLEISELARSPAQVMVAIGRGLHSAESSGDPTLDAYLKRLANWLEQWANLSHLALEGQLHVG